MHYFFFNLRFLMTLIKLRMEMGNVSKRQQPDQIKNNSRGSPTGLVSGAQQRYILYNDILSMLN